MYICVYIYIYIYIQVNIQSKFVSDCTLILCQVLFQLDFTCSNFFAMYYANKNLITLAHYISKLFNTTSNLFETKHDVLIKTYYQFKYKLNQ